MSQFTEPVEKLVQDSKSYLDSQLEGFKLRIVKGLSEATRGLGELLVVLTVAGIFLLTLSFAFVMWIGEMLGSYAVGAFIVAGVLLLLAVILILLRGKLFKNTFVSLYTGIIAPERNEADAESLDKAIGQMEEDIRVQDQAIQHELKWAMEFYKPARLVNEALRLTGEKAGRLGFRLGSFIPVLYKILKGRRKKI